MELFGNYEWMPRIQLPKAVLGSAFTVKMAQAAGVTRKRLRGKDLGAPFHGVRCLEEATEEQNLAALWLLLPGHAFLCDESAAKLQGLPLPWGSSRIALCNPIVAVPPDCPRIRRAKVRGCQRKVEEQEIQNLRGSGMRATSTARTWLDLSQKLDLPDLLALTDHLIRPYNRLNTADDLRRIHDRNPKVRGRRNREWALEYMDPRAESAMESITRAILLEGGLPKPLCNQTIELPGGRIVRVDLLFPDYDLIVEYDGDQHRDQRKWRVAVTRNSLLQEAGYMVMVITGDDLKKPEDFVERVKMNFANRHLVRNRR